MPKKTVVVTRTKHPETRLPDLFAEGAALVHYLAEGRFFDAVQERLKVDRSSGYAGVDAVLLLVYYFAASMQVGLNGFDKLVGHHRDRLGALGERRGLPTQSSMSRLLGDMVQGDVATFGSWLLRGAVGIYEVLRHPSVLFIDACGRPWHVFHYDPTKIVLRGRALPEGGDLAPAHRRTATFAAPGYTGHKRGEVTVHRPTLQHAGSRLWLHANLAPGNGDQRQGLRLACATTVECGDQLKHPRSQLLLVVDGEFGHVPSLTEIRANGICAITRLNRLELLGQDDVQTRLATGTWYFVPDSCSGPRRSAMDLGVVTVRPGAKTEQDDGEPYEPIDVRVVVSRYPREGKAEHGRVIDGWQYELFAALDLDPEAWPAPDVVTEYHHRGGQENGFAQEDRELQLDRVLSYHIAGQELAVLVGLAVWNLRLVLGFRMNPLPEERAPALRRVMEVDPRPFGTVADDTSKDAAEAPLAAPEPCPQSSVADDPRESTGEPSPDPSDAVPVKPMDAIRSVLLELDYSRFLRRHPGWSLSVDEASLRCPAEQALRLCGAYKKNRGGFNLAFHAAAGVCGACPLRSTCLGSANPDAVKQVSLAVPQAMAAAVAEQMSAVHRDRRVHRSEEVHSGPSASGRPRRARVGESLPVAPSADDVQPGDWEISRGQLLPAKARSAFRAACRAMVVEVQVVVPPIRRMHPYLVTSAKQRQHRRATWAERQARYALPSEAKITILFEGASSISTILSPQGVASRLHA